MIVNVGDVAVDLIEEGDRVVAHLKSGKPFEVESLAIWSTLCARGGIALDIGAYSGLFAIAAAKKGCEVFAFEPMPFNAARCRENIARNGVAVELLEVAVSDRSGFADIVFNPRVPFTAGASLIRKSGERHRVEVVTIDRLCLSNVRAIKIDVERNEPAVLRGAAETIERCKPSILVEVLDDERKSGVRAALPGYTVAREIDDRNWLMIPC